MLFDPSSVKKITNEELERDLSLAEESLLSIVEEIKKILDYDVSDLPYAEIDTRLLHVIERDKRFAGLHLRFARHLQRYTLLQEEFDLRKKQIIQEWTSSVLQKISGGYFS